MIALDATLNRNGTGLPSPNRPLLLRVRKGLVDGVDRPRVRKVLVGRTPATRPPLPRMATRPWPTPRPNVMDPPLGGRPELSGAAWDPHRPRRPGPGGKSHPYGLVLDAREEEGGWVSGVPRTHLPKVGSLPGAPMTNTFLSTRHGLRVLTASRDTRNGSTAGPRGCSPINGTTTGRPAVLPPRPKILVPATTMNGLVARRGSTSGKSIPGTETVRGRHGHGGRVQRTRVVAEPFGGSPSWDCAQQGIGPDNGPGTLVVL